MKIVSRVSEEQEELYRLQSIVEAGCSMINLDDGDEVEGADNLHDLITQVDVMTVSYMEALDVYAQDISDLTLQNQKMGSKLNEYELTIDQVNAIATGDVEYDEDLDHATQDLLDSLVGCGAAEGTFDGEIAFASEIVLTKEDMKPHLRQAIENWLRLKIA